MSSELAAGMVPLQAQGGGADFSFFLMMGAIFLIFRGLNEYAAGTPPAAEYHATVAALKQLLRGRLFGPA